jgi:uncharacterized membrane protein
VRSVLRFLGPTCLAAGVILLIEAVRTGGARLFLFLIFPVLSGSSVVFGLAVVFLVIGLFLLPFVFVDGEPSEIPASGTVPAGPSSTHEEGGAGGLVLIGPVPIFFGSWRRRPPISYRWAVLIGVVLAVLAILWVWGFSVV